MIDTYLKSKSQERLQELRTFAKNVIGPIQGAPATEAQASEDGSIAEAQPPKGDPDYWYVCVRFLLPIQPDNDIKACDTEEGQAVCGLWA